MSPDQRLYKVKDQKNDQQPVKPISYSVVKSGLIGFTKPLCLHIGVIKM